MHEHDLAAWRHDHAFNEGNPVVEEIREVIEPVSDSGDTRITDLHVWRVGRGAYACEVSLLTRNAALTPAKVREQLSIHEEIVHVTVEINRYR